MKLVKTLSTLTQTYILAGGRGERLLPLTLDRPKPAVPFGGPFRIIDFTISNCVRSALGPLRLLTQFKHEELHRCIWNRWGKYLVCLPSPEGKPYRGTADAVFRNLKAQQDRADYTLVLSGDHIYHMDYRELLQRHASTGADLTIATVEHPTKDASRFGVVEIDANGRVLGFQEKPQSPKPIPGKPGTALISMGLYVFKTELLVDVLREDSERCDSNHDFAKDVVPRYLASRKVYAYDFRNPMDGKARYWRDIGTIDSYHAASMDLVFPSPKFNPFRVASMPDVLESPEFGAERTETRLHDGRVRSSVLSPGVRIGKGAEIEESVLMRGAHIGEGARIRRAIIEEGVEIPAWVQIGFNPEEDRENHFVSDTGITVVRRSVPPTTRFRVHERNIRFISGRGAQISEEVVA